MKKLILSITAIFSFLVIQAQTDIIYPAKSKISIHKCKITEIRDGNIVYYIKNSKPDTVEAVAIYKDGNYITLSTGEMAIYHSQNRLYNGWDYDHYGKKYKRSKIMKIIGIVLSVAGFGAQVYGVTDDTFTHGYIWMVGTTVLSVGVPLWMLGGIKASNNKKAMEIINRKTNLSFGATNNGVGLVLNF